MVVVEQSTKVPATQELVTVVVTVAVARLVLVLVSVKEIKSALASPSVGSIRPASITSPISWIIWLVSWSTMGPVRARPSRQTNGRNPLMAETVGQLADWVRRAVKSDARLLSGPGRCWVKQVSHASESCPWRLQGGDNFSPDILYHFNTETANLTIELREKCFNNVFMINFDKLIKMFD